jgi:hypothetical protein
MKRLLPLFLILLLLLSACGPAQTDEGGQALPPAAETAAPEAPAPEASAPDIVGPDEDELPILTDYDRPASSPSPAEETVPGLSGTVVTLDGLSSYLRVDLPEGWTWEQAGGTVEGTVYGLWPEADPDFKVELHYWPEKFAMCGTGVTFQDYTLPNGEKATLAYERIGDEISWVLILPEAPDSFTIQFAVPYSLYESHRAELELLLGTIRQGVLAQLDVVTPETSAD